MSVKLYLNDDKNPKKMLLWILSVLVLAFVCLAVTMFASMVFALFLQYGWNEKSFRAFDKFLGMLRQNPLSLWYAYENWAEFFIASLLKGKISLAMFLPLTAPIVFIFIMFLAYLKSSYSFSLWYRLNNRFAKEDDVRKMGLLNGMNMAFGRFGEFIVGTNRASAVLCMGEDGCGKTSCVAIPSVLRSDNACIVVADNSGAIAKYTSGHRSGLGKVFYFNWDLKDDAAKGDVYPRWNPLSPMNMPSKGPKRDEYLAFLAGYMVGEESKVNKENYWQWLAFVAVEAGLQFLINKIELACANDYFLGQIIDNQRLSRDDKDILLSYYAMMPPEYAKMAIGRLEKNKLSAEDYMPIGSWGGIPEDWQGKEANLSMFSDWLLSRYFEEQMNIEVQNGDGWKPLLEKLLAEALIFNYSPKAIMGLRQLSYLSKKQRNIVFPMLLKPLMVFRNSCVRERMSCSDFYTSQIRGIRDAENRQWQPITIYCSANNKSSRFVNRLFIDTLIKYGLGEHKHQGPLPLMMVFDDLGATERYRGLHEAIIRGPQNKMSFLMLCSRLRRVEEVYGLGVLEDIVSNTNYKIIMADDNHKLGRQLSKLAIYGTKSVQIPAVSTGAFLKVKTGLADANYYYRLAKECLSRKKVDVVIRGYQLLLTEGYYHLPVLVKSILFLKDDKFRSKALLDANYFLDKGLYANRNIQDNEVPEFGDVLYSKDIGIEDDAELDRYLEIKYDESLQQIQTVPDKASVLADDISNKWQSHNSVVDSEGEEKDIPDEDWWLEEESFSLSGDKASEDNPFKTK